MTGFKPEFLKFLAALARNNNAEWFNTNRKVYEKEVKKPFNDFVGEMISRIRKYEPRINITPADAIMRINKDVRFAKDKTPYNTHMAANISEYGKKDKSFPGFYFQLSPAGVNIYGGAYVVETDVLQKIRQYTSRNLSAFAAAYNDKAFKEKYGTIQGEQNKRIPPEFQSVAEKEPLIANKQFYYKADFKAAKITSDDLADELMEYYRAGIKVNEFLKKAIRS